MISKPGKFSFCLFAYALNMLPKNIAATIVICTDKRYIFSLKIFRIGVNAQLRLVVTKCEAFYSRINDR
jgi:hypothetical protein